MIRIFLTASFALMFVGAVAQSPTIRTQRNENNSVDFILENKTRPGTLTVFLTLRDLQNCNTASGTFRYETRYTGTRLLSLRPADDTRGVRYGYSYRFFLGPVDKEPDTAFVYRMPTTVRWPVRVSRGVSVYDRFRKEKKGALGLHFEMEKGDTVYAMRRGTVVEVGIPEREPDAPAVSFTSESPDLLVKQPDGTLAWYTASTATMCWSRSGTKCCPERRWRWREAMTASDTKFPCRPSGGRVIRTRRSGSENLSSASISFRSSLRRRVSCALKRVFTDPLKPRNW